MMLWFFFVALLHTPILGNLTEAIDTRAIDESSSGFVDITPASANRTSDENLTDVTDTTTIDKTSSGLVDITLTSVNQTPDGYTIATPSHSEQNKTVTQLINEPSTVSPEVAESTGNVITTPAYSEHNGTSTQLLNDSSTMNPEAAESTGHITTTPTYSKQNEENSQTNYESSSASSPFSESTGYLETSRAYTEQNENSTQLNNYSSPASSSVTESTASSVRDLCLSQNGFYCESSTECIPAIWQCDATVDCPSREDELECQTTTTTARTTTTALSLRESCERQGYFYCASSYRCIAMWHRCDGSSYCYYGEDEAGCASSTSATTYTTLSASDSCQHQGNFYCSSSALCVPLSQRCDGYYNCDYGEDEVGCSTSSPAPTTTPLLHGDSCEDLGGFWCASSHLCVPQSERCNGYSYCSDGEDEDDCSTSSPVPTTPTTAFPGDSCLRQGNYYCEHSRQCIPASYRCDGYRDCASNEDESGCTTTSQLPMTSVSLLDSCLRQGNYYCEYSRQCIPASYRCDGYRDCISNEDESGCTTTSQLPTTTVAERDSCLRQGQFYCEYSRQCIPAWYRCDGSADCYYSEDESQCASTTTRSHSSSAPCGGTLYGSGVIFSPNYPEEYSNNVFCSWTLHANPPGSSLVVQFRSFETELFSDIVGVLLENGLTSNYSGSMLPPRIVLGRSGTIIFISDSRVTAGGFYMTFTSFEFSAASTTELHRGCVIAVIVYVAALLQGLPRFH